MTVITIYNNEGYKVGKLMYKDNRLVHESNEDIFVEYGTDGTINEYSINRKNEINERISKKHGCITAILTNINKVHFGMDHSYYYEYRKTFSLDGKLKLICGKGIRNISLGPYISYHDNGTLHIKCMYINGKLNGEYICYDENGIVKIHALYDHGVMTYLY